MPLFFAFRYRMHHSTPTASSRRLLIVGARLLTMHLVATISTKLAILPRWLWKRGMWRSGSSSTRSSSKTPNGVADSIWIGSTRLVMEALQYVGHPMPNAPGKAPLSHQPLLKHSLPPNYNPQRRFPDRPDNCSFSGTPGGPSFWHFGTGRVRTQGG